MRESFVFHEDFICDLPESYKADFMRYTVEYGLYGENPPLEDGTLEMALWRKIARRIDAEAEKYNEISAKRKEAAQRRYQQHQQRTEQKAEAPAEKEAQKAKPFAKPTPEEIRAYCEECGNGVDAQAFFDFYESKGWKVGAVKMKDWRASVRTWAQRKKSESTGGRLKPGAAWGKENEIPEEIESLF